MFKKVNTDIATDVTINISHIVLMSGPVLKMSTGDEVILTSESMYEVEAIMYPVKKTTKSNEPKAELNELFDKLHKLVGGKGTAVFTLQREKKLSELLTKHRMTVELLIKAATNIGKDPFLQGDNDNKKRYGDIDYLLRPDKAAKWSEDQTEKKKGMF